MIFKTFKIIQRDRKLFKDARPHSERVMIETYWLLFVPVYRKEKLVSLDI